MKLKYTCLLYLLLISFSSFSQDEKKSTASVPRRNPATAATRSATTQTTGFVSPLTGVWRGFFTSGSGFFQEKYKYEVQIGQLSNNGIKGVTYSYKTTVFYGKANLAGLYAPTTKNLVLKENKLLEVKMTSGDACLMTCYLEYSKVGNVEVLEGTFTSVNIDRNTDCGSGRVYLEKVTESDFYKEDFVKEYEARKKTVTNSTAKVTPKAGNNTPRRDRKLKPVDSSAIVNRNPVKKDEIAVRKTPPAPTPPATPQKNTEKVVVTSVEPPRKPLSKDLIDRDKVVAKVIKTEGDEIQIDLYDNGQIDDDTVTVYHNNEVVAYKQRLCHQPITIRVKADASHPRHEFVMVADNLGSIPPNTALMVITVGRQRYEVFLTSSLQKSATVIVDCKVPSDDSR